MPALTEFTGLAGPHFLCDGLKTVRACNISGPIIINMILFPFPAVAGP